MGEERYFVAVVRWGDKWNKEGGYFEKSGPISDWLFKQVEHLPKVFEPFARLPYLEIEGFRAYSAGVCEVKRLDGGTDFVSGGHLTYEQYEAVKKCPDWLTEKQMDDAGSAR